MPVADINAVGLIFDMGCEHPPMYEVNARTMARHLAYWHGEVSCYAGGFGSYRGDRLEVRMRKDAMRALHTLMHVRDDD